MVYKNRCPLSTLSVPCPLTLVPLTPLFGPDICEQVEHLKPSKSVRRNHIPGFIIKGRLGLLHLFYLKRSNIASLPVTTLFQFLNIFLYYLNFLCVIRVCN
jgi:hypothetical protein